MLTIDHFKDASVGFALVAILPTYYRFADGVGVGELALLVISFILITLSIVRGRFHLRGTTGRFATILVAYIFLVLFPLTLLGSYFDVPGVQFRDWAAYALSASFIFACAVSRLNAVRSARYFIFFLCLLIVVQYNFGGDEVWYSARFTAGANNPNQFGLYVICGAFLSLLCIADMRLRLLALGVILFGGMLTRSDALVATAGAAAITYLSVISVPRRAQIIALPFVLGVGILTWLAFGGDIATWLLEKWGSADPRGARTALYINGLRAWLDTPFTALMGHGAGSFSGLSGPYLGAEAHNTPIDMLMMGGLPALIVCYSVFALVFARAYQNGKYTIMVATVGIVAFSLFHYVGRQPIWWFTIYGLAYISDSRYSIRDHRQTVCNRYERRRSSHPGRQFKCLF